MSEPPLQGANVAGKAWKNASPWKNPNPYTPPPPFKGGMKA